MPIEELYQEIGRGAIALTDDDLDGLLLVYAEVLPGMIEADVIYRKLSGDVQVVIGPSSLRDDVYELWKRWLEGGEKERWRAMTYRVEGDGQFHVDFTYPDQFDEDELHRRRMVIEKYFGKAKVIYPDFSI